MTVHTAWTMVLQRRVDHSWVDARVDDRPQRMHNRPAGVMTGDNLTTTKRPDEQAAKTIVTSGQLLQYRGATYSVLDRPAGVTLKCLPMKNPPGNR